MKIFLRPSLPFHIIPSKGGGPLLFSLFVLLSRVNNFPSLLPLRLALCFSWNYKFSVNYSGSKMNTQRLFRLIQTTNEAIANRGRTPSHSGLDPASSPARSGIPGLPLSRNDYWLFRDSGLLGDREVGVERIWNNKKSDQ